MGRHFQVNVVVSRAVQFEAQTVESLLAEVRLEAGYWSRIFPRGVKNHYSDTVLVSNYTALLREIANHPFETGALELKGWSDLAIFPHRHSVEGRALSHYAETGLAFVIVWFLWAESGWLDDGAAKCGAERVAEGIGEMLVTAVRLGKSF